MAQLTAWSRRPKTALALAERAKIILASASGATSVDVAAAVGVDRNAVGKRHGTTSLFAALNVASGKVIARCEPRHRAVEFRRFLKTIPRCHPPSTFTWCSTTPARTRPRP